MCDTRPLYSAVRKAAVDAGDENRWRDRSVVIPARTRVTVGIMTRKMVGTAITAASSPYQASCIAVTIVLELSCTAQGPSGSTVRRDRMPLMRRVATLAS